MALPPPPPYWNPDFIEQLSERFQDVYRDGYVNMGDNNSFFHSGSISQFINGQTGADFITLEGSSADTVYGGSGADNIDAGGGNDTVYGGSGWDTIFGGAGADRLYGGSGNDVLNGDNDAVDFSLHGIDTMFGGSGQDTLYGGGKADIMSGGSGNDTFLYKVGIGAENESRVGAADHITDFQTGDKIDVSAIDADGNAANGNSAFTFSANASTQAGTCWVEHHDDGQHIFFNINGGAPDMEIISDDSHVFTASDFHL
jgi:Ca2+-binding RTX toxin-like protein